MKEEVPQEEGRRREEAAIAHPEDDVKRVLRELIPEGSRAEFIDHGSEKLVFKFNPLEKPGKKPNRQSIVYKVDYRASLWKDGALRDLQRPQTEGVARHELQEAIDERKKEVANLREVFGYHAVPPERSSVQLLPMSADLYNAIKRHDMEAIDETPERIPALVTIQKRIELDPKKAVDLTAGYAETPRKREEDAPEIDQEVYEAAHQRLMGGSLDPREHKDPQEREQALAECLALYPSLKKVIAHAEDPAFREQLKIAARGLVTYANRPEGTVLDMAGGHNMVIAEKPGEKGDEKSYQLYLLDALPPAGTMNQNHLKDIAEKIQHRKGLTPDERIEALNIFHMVRMANALAIIAELPDRAQLPKKVRDIPALIWRDVLEGAWSKEEREEASRPDHEVPPSSAATRAA